MFYYISLIMVLFLFSCGSDPVSATHEHYHYYESETDTLHHSDTVHTQDTTYITNTVTITDTVYQVDTVYAQSPDYTDFFTYENTTDWKYGNKGTEIYTEGQSIRYLNTSYNLEKIVYKEFGIVVDSLIRWINHTPSDTYIGNKIYGE